MRNWLRAAEESNRLYGCQPTGIDIFHSGCHRRELFRWEAERSEALKHVLGLKGLLLHLTRLWAKQEVWKKQSLKMLLMHEIVIDCVKLISSVNIQLEGNNLIWICMIWGTHTTLLTKQINWSNPDELSLCTKVIKFMFSQKCNFCHHLLPLISLQFCKLLFFQWNTKIRMY